MVKTVGFVDDIVIFTKGHHQLAEIWQIIEHFEKNTKFKKNKTNMITIGGKGLAVESRGSARGIG